jgi:hypothetical protein
MRFAAQRTIGMQDMLPADGSIYMPNMDNKMGSMMEALKAWEKKRGLSYSFKGKFIENRPKKKTEEKAKAKAPADRPIKVPRDLPAITVPRERRKPGRVATLTKEERRQRKNENNRLYRIKHNAEARARSKKWRANQSPEQRAKQLERVKAWKASQRENKLAAANKGSSVQAAGVPLANSAVSGA